MAKAEEFAARREREGETEDVEADPTTPLVEGRRQVTGVILSTKWQDSQYGETLKMLVKEDDGNKVWGTVPTVLQNMTLSTQYHDENGMWQEIEAPLPGGLKGQAVVFTATVERSRVAGRGKRAVSKTEAGGYIKIPAYAGMTYTTY